MITREEFEKALDTYRLCRRAGSGNDLRKSLYVLIRRGPTIDRPEHPKTGVWEMPVTFTADDKTVYDIWVGSLTLWRMNQGDTNHEILVDRGMDRSEPKFGPWTNHFL